MIALLQFFLLTIQQQWVPCAGVNSGDVAYTFSNGTTEKYSLFKEGFGSGGVFTGFYAFLENSDTIMAALFIANLIAILFVSQVLYFNTYHQNGIRDEDSDEDSGSDDEEEGEGEEEDEGVIYEGQYFKQLEEMPEAELLKEELALIGKNVLIEETPKGLVHMVYNVESETFDYYTDHFVEVTYEILDTVARLFAITFHCKKVCVNYQEEVLKGEKKMLSEMEFDKLRGEKEKLEGVGKEKEKERSVFATFKSYNNGVGCGGGGGGMGGNGKNLNGKNLSKKYYILTEKANRFKFKGKLSDYEKKYNKPALEESKPNYINISYSDYKKKQAEKNDSMTAL